MKKALIHVGFVMGILALISLCIAAWYVNEYSLSFAYLFATCTLSYGYMQTAKAHQPTSNKAKDDCNIMKDFYELQRCNNEILEIVRQRKEYLMNTTPPTAWWDGVHEMD